MRRSWFSAKSWGRSAWCFASPARIRISRTSRRWSSMTCATTITSRCRRPRGLPRWLRARPSQLRRPSVALGSPGLVSRAVLHRSAVSPLRSLRRPRRSKLPGVWKPRTMRWGAMLIRTFKGATLGAALALSAAAFAAVPAAAQVTVSEADEIRAGELAVPLNKSQVLRTDRPFAKALIGNPEIADVLPLSDSSLYVLGKKMGTTSLTLYDRGNRLIAVVDVAVGPDVISLKRQLSELMPSDQVGARISNDSVVLEGIVSSGPAADRAVQLAETYAPGKVINLMQIGSAQQVMLEVRFSEIKRGALKDIGFSGFLSGSGDNGFAGAIGGGASLTSSTGSTTTTTTVGGVTTSTTTPNPPQLSLGAIVDS